MCSNSIDVRLPRWLSIGLLFASFTLYSAVRTSVPAVNEPHYLAKAKHYWQPNWCARDFFLESANAHLFFFQTVGALTAVAPLPQAAWIGRLAAFVLLAIGWQRLLERLASGWAAPLLSAWVFLLLQSLGNFSGEWLVGGVEAKVFSYAFAFWAGGCFLDRRLVRAALLAGLAVSFHPIVGLWSVLLVGAAAAVGRRRSEIGGRRSAVEGQRSAVEGEQSAGDVAETPTSDVRLPTSVSWRTALVAAALCLVASLPGLVPAARMVLEANPDVARQADLIQVGYRLAHHLDPLQFPVASYRHYGLLLVVWLLLRRLAPVNARQRRFERVVMASLVLAVVGWLAAVGPRPIQQMPLYELRIKVLKFYPFRMADLLVPLLVAATAAQAARERLTAGDLSQWRRRAVYAAFAAALVVAIVVPGADRNPSRMDPTARADWLEACRWLRENAPPAAVLYAVNEDWAVKWYAQRPEYVNFKDCPQDAAGIVDWYTRMRTFSRWSQSAYQDARFSKAEVQDLAARTGITHLVCSRFGPFDVEPAFKNRTFRVYELSPGETQTSR